MMGYFYSLLGSGPAHSPAYLEARSLFEPEELAAIKQQFRARAEQHEGIDQRQLLVRRSCTCLRVRTRLPLRSTRTAHTRDTCITLTRHKPQEWCGLSGCPPVIADGLFSAILKTAATDDASASAAAAANTGGGGSSSSSGRLCSLDSIVIAKARCEKQDEGSATEFAFSILDAEGRGTVSRWVGVCGGWWRVVGIACDQPPPETANNTNRPTNLDRNAKQTKGAVGRSDRGPPGLVAACAPAGRPPGSERGCHSRRVGGDSHHVDLRFGSSTLWCVYACISACIYTTTFNI
jgi:hypothetical protein